MKKVAKAALDAATAGIPGAISNMGLQETQKQLLLQPQVQLLLQPKLLKR